MAEWHLYLIRTRRGALYTGITTDVDRRLAEHQSGGTRAARALRSRGPLRLVYSARVGDRSAASRLEAAVKRLPKVDKEAIVAHAPDAKGLLARLVTSYLID